MLPPWVPLEMARESLVVISMYANKRPSVWCPTAEPLLSRHALVYPPRFAPRFGWPNLIRVHVHSSAMNPVCSLFRASIGKKFLMAVTGAVLIAFVTGPPRRQPPDLRARPTRSTAMPTFCRAWGRCCGSCAWSCWPACDPPHLDRRPADARELPGAAGEIRRQPHHPGHARLAHHARGRASWCWRSSLYHLAQFTVGWAQTGRLQGPCCPNTR